LATITEFVITGFPFEVRDFGLVSARRCDFQTVSSDGTKEQPCRAVGVAAAARVVDAY
jgi:hypothetical protein